MDKTDKWDRWLLNALLVIAMSVIAEKDFRVGEAEAEIGDRFRREVRVHHERVRNGRDQRERGESTLSVVREILEQARIFDMVRRRE